MDYYSNGILQKQNQLIMRIKIFAFFANPIQEIIIYCKKIVDKNEILIKLNERINDEKLNPT